MALLLVAALLPSVGEAIVRIDGWVTAALHAHVNAAGTTGFRLVTELGGTAVLVVAAAVAAAGLTGFGRRHDAALIILTLAGAEALTWSLKALFRRERPSFDDPVATASSFSYPSGHALVSLAVYGALVYVLLNSLRSRRARVACVTGAALLIGAIGLSRLYLGLHYLSDVLAGFTVGFAWLLVTTTVCRRSPHLPRLGLAPLALVAAFVLAFATACGSSDDSAAPELPQADEPVELKSADFVDGIDNPYWPMAPGSKWIYREQGGGPQVEVTVTSGTKKILGIEATVVHDVETEDGEVVEDTYDWFAQDKWGSVWYLGEDTKEYEDGKVISTTGSWEHGVDGAQAGIVMPADPEVGMTFRQEYYAGEAEDRGEILSLDEQATVPFGSFDGVLKTKDTTPLEPKVLEHKYYARGIGPVLAVGVAGGSREELIRFER